MGKVDWINWKTNTNEIINPKKVEKELNNYFSNYNTYMNAVVYEQIKYEATNGGLTNDNLIINNSSYLNDKANEILKKIENIKEEYNNMKNRIINNSIEQKKIEKNQLIKAIETKIEEEKKKIEKINNNESIEDELLCNMTKEESLEEIQRRINVLNKRLDQAKSL